MAPGARLGSRPREDERRTCHPPPLEQDEDVSLALAALCADAAQHAPLCAAGIAPALLAILRHGSGEARANAAWAAASLAPHPPARRALLAGGVLPLLLAVAAPEAEAGKVARRDATRALSWLVWEPQVGPASQGGRTLRVLLIGAMSRDPELQARC